MVTTGGAEGETKRKRTASLWQLKRNRGKREKKRENENERETGCPFVVDLFRCRRRRRWGFPFHCTHTPLCFVISPNFLRVQKFESVTLLTNRPRHVLTIYMCDRCRLYDYYHAANKITSRIFSEKEKMKRNPYTGEKLNASDISRRNELNQRMNRMLH